MRSRLEPILIALSAVILRVLYLLQVRGTPITDVLLIDSETYDRLAGLVRSGAFRGEEVYAMNVLYPYFLALSYGPGEGSVLGAFLVQIGLDAATCVLTWWIGRRLFGPLAGRIAGIAAAAYAPFIFYSVTLLTPTLVTFLVTATVALLVRYMDRPRGRWALAAGLCVGLAALGRGNNALLIPLAVLLFVWFAGSRRRAAAHTALFVGGAAVLLVGVTVRNYLVEREVVPVAANYAAFYIGHHDGANGLYSMPRITSGARFEAEVWGTRDALAEELGRELSLAESAQILFQRGVRWAFDHPRRELELAATKLYSFWNRTESPTNLSVYFAREFSSLLRTLPLPFGAVGPLALAGMVLGFGVWRRRAILYFVVVVHVLTAVVFFMSAEYRLPAVPVLLIFAAFGAIELGRRLGGAVRGRPGARSAGLWVAIGALVAGAAAANVRTPLLRNQSLLRVDYLNFGNLYRDRGELDTARALLQRSLDIDPRYSPAYGALAAVYEELGNESEAARLAQMARRFRPAGAVLTPEERIAEGTMAAGQLYGTGRHREALEAFTTLLGEAEAVGNPRLSRSLRNNIGLCHYKLGDLDRAARMFQALIDEDPTYVKAYNNLARVMEVRGRPVEAIALYRQALGIEPDNQKTLRALQRLGVPAPGSRP